MDKGQLPGKESNWESTGLVMRPGFARRGSAGLPCHLCQLALACSGHGRGGQGWDMCRPREVDRYTVRLPWSPGQAAGLWVAPALICWLDGMGWHRTTGLVPSELRPTGIRGVQGRSWRQTLGRGWPGVDPQSLAWVSHDHTAGFPRGEIIKEAFASGSAF